MKYENTSSIASPLTAAPVVAMDFPLVKPHSLTPNQELDREYLEFVYQDELLSTPCAWDE